MAWEKVRDEVLIKSGRHCCICHKFCALKIELHHIVLKSEGGGDTFDNCIPLCFDCHADMRSYDSKHPKGTKYSHAELKGHRDKWYDLVSHNLGTGTSDHLKQDIHTFEKIVEILPANPTIIFLRDFDFRGRWFLYKNLDPIPNLLLKLIDEPWIEFFDMDIESIKVELVSKLHKFDRLTLQNIFRSESSLSDQAGVPREWEREQPERYELAVNGLNNTADEIVGLYEKFIRICRRKLGVII